MSFAHYLNNQMKANEELKIRTLIVRNEFGGEQHCKEHCGLKLKAHRRSMMAYDLPGNFTEPLVTENLNGIRNVPVACSASALLQACSKVLCLTKGCKGQNKFHRQGLYWRQTRLHLWVTCEVYWGFYIFLFFSYNRLSLQFYLYYIFLAISTIFLLRYQLQSKK